MNGRFINKYINNSFTCKFRVDYIKCVPYMLLKCTYIFILSRPMSKYGYYSSHSVNLISEVLTWYPSKNLINEHTKSFQFNFLS